MLGRTITFVLGLTNAGAAIGATASTGTRRTWSVAVAAGAGAQRHPCPAHPNPQGVQNSGGMLPIGGHSRLTRIVGISSCSLTVAASAAYV